jgi:beta-galactosidase
VLNTEGGNVELSSVPSGIDLLTGKHVEGRLSLGPHGCAVIRYSGLDPAMMGSVIGT